MNDKIIKQLLSEAKEIANRNFCCKHSNFTVGISLLSANGKIYKGFNIENDSIQSICAERVAFSKALTDNEKEFTCLLVVGKNINEKLFKKTLPCGYCRQFLSEYVRPDFKIYTYDDEEQKLYSYTLKELLPNNFSL